MLPQDYAPSDKLSVFNYRGPRGMRICGLLDAQDATLGLDLTSPAGGHLRWCDVVVATPAAAGTLYATEASYFDDLRVVVVSTILVPAFSYSSLFHWRILF